MARFLCWIAALALNVAMLNEASAQPKAVIRYPGCQLSIRPTGGEIFRLGDNGDVLISGLAWSPADGCEQMFRSGLHIDPSLPVVCPQQISTERECPEVQPCVDKAASLLEETAQCNQGKIEALETARTGQMFTAQTLISEKEVLLRLLATVDASPRRNPESDVIASSTIRIVDDRLAIIDQQIREILPAVRAGSVDQRYMQRARELEEKNNQLTKHKQTLLQTLQETQGTLARSKLNESLLQGWLVDVVIVIATFFTTALLFWLSLWAMRQYVARRRAAVESRVPDHDDDMKWLRTAIDEQTWLVTRTRWLPILVGSLFVISAFTVVVNVFVSGASVIDVVRGGALLVTFVAVIKVALDADAWHRDLRKELLNMIEQYKKYGPNPSAIPAA